MHDPCTVAHEIRYPWWTHRPWPEGKERWEDLTPRQQRRRSQYFRGGYRSAFVTIWHVDPQRGGSDDSCGFSFPHLEPLQRERLKGIAWSESRYPYFLRCHNEKFVGTRHEAECLYRGLVLLVADAIDLPMSYDEAARYAAKCIHRADTSDAARVFCFVPGYHTNFREDTAEHRQDHFAHVLSGIARNLLRERRPWYRHPRWHVHHWRIQVHPWLSLKRWLFTRCGHCGKRFGWNESGLAAGWSTGVIYHHGCYAKAIGAGKPAETTKG